MAREIVRPPNGTRYEITLCGECDQQAERNVYDDWACGVHGRCKTIRVAEVQLARLVLGKPIEAGLLEGK